MTTEPGNHGPREIPRPGLALAAVLAMVFSVHSAALRVPFLWDDGPLVVDSPATRTLSPAVHLGGAFWRRDARHDAAASYYRPVATFSYALDRAISGPRPGAFHLTNVLVHVAVTALVFALARRAGATAPAAGLAAALFGLAPRLTETVTWISGRTDALAAAFGLLALWLHASGPERTGRRVLAAITLLAALLAKEVAAVVWVGLATLEILAARAETRTVRAIAARLAPATAAVVAFLALRGLALAGRPRVPLYPTPTYLPRRLVPLQVLGHYAEMLTDPLRPRLRIGWLGAPEPWHVAAGTAALVLGMAVAVAALRRRIPPLAAAGLAVAMGALGMVCEIVPLHLQVAAADRFLYLPLAGIAIAAAGTTARLRGALARGLTIAALLAVPVFAVATSVRIADWQDRLRLWQKAAAEAAPADALPHLELGNALTAAARYDEALREYDATARTALAPYRGYALLNAGDVLARLGRLDEARARFAVLVAAEPWRPIAWLNLASADLRLFHFEDAEREVREAMRLIPNYDEARTVLAMIPEIRAEHASLPPETSGEPTAIAARRAALWTRLRVPGRAAPLWLAVAQAPDATPPQVVRAAAYLASEGPQDDAARAIARLRAGGAPGRLVSELEAVVAARSAANP